MRHFSGDDLSPALCGPSDASLIEKIVGGSASSMSGDGTESAWALFGNRGPVARMAVNELVRRMNEGE